jgi:hypothetical protein
MRYIMQEMENFLLKFVVDINGTNCFVSVNLENDNEWIINSISCNSNNIATIIQQDSPIKIKYNTVLRDAYKYTTMSYNGEQLESVNGIFYDNKHHSTRQLLLKSINLNSTKILSIPINNGFINNYIKIILWVTDPLNAETINLQQNLDRLSNICLNYYLYTHIENTTNSILTTYNKVSTKAKNVLKFIEGAKWINKPNIDNIVVGQMVKIISRLSDLNELYNLRTNKIRASPSKTSLELCVKTAISTITEEYNYEFKYYISPEVPKTIYVDGFKIKQILIILLENACNNIVESDEKKEPSVLLTISSDVISDDEESSEIDSEDSIISNKYEITFTITDNGTTNYVKKSYNTADGIKLIIADKLASILNSSIEYKTTENKENCSTFTLAAFDDEKLQNIKPLDSMKLLHHQKILIIHSNLNTRISLCKMLKSYSIEYSTASVIKEAIFSYLSTSDIKFKIIICENSDSHPLQELVSFLLTKKLTIPIISVGKFLGGNSNHPSISDTFKEEDLIMAIFNVLN